MWRQCSSESLGQRQVSSHLYLSDEHVGVNSERNIYVVSFKLYPNSSTLQVLFQSNLVIMVFRNYCSVHRAEYVLIGLLEFVKVRWSPITSPSRLFPCRDFSPSCAYPKFKYTLGALPGSSQPVLNTGTPMNPAMARKRYIAFRFWHVQLLNRRDFVSKAVSTARLLPEVPLAPVKASKPSFHPIARSSLVLVLKSIHILNPCFPD